ncbi:MAG: STAS domain-containing protein [Syntrophorhabdaceae bacterium]|nr:STAS domain-containing protein [Syntrophorhabdaceae bacterium]
MHLESVKTGGVLIVKPSEKRIDASVATEFKGKMVDWINEGNTKIILDLVNVDFIDSSGLGAIVSSLKAIGGNGDLVISGLQETVMGLFRLTRMNKVFQIFSSEQEAIQALSKM